MKFLICFLLFFATSLTTHAYQCSFVLVKPKKTVQDIRDVLDNEPLNRGLSEQALGRINLLINEIDRLSLNFNEKWTEQLAPYGLKFLPRVRKKFEELSTELNHITTQVSSELKRFRKEENASGRVEIYKLLKQLESHPALAYIQNSKNLYFSLDYFVHTLTVNGSRPGYHLADLNGSLSQSMTEEDILTVDNNFLNVVSDETFPLTTIGIPSKTDRTGERFSGFPLTEDILNFFSKRGDKEGHVFIASPLVYQRSSWLQIFKKRLPIVTSRWDEKNQAPFEIVSYNGESSSLTENALSDPESYTWVPSQPIIVAPALPVQEQVEKKVLQIFSEGRVYYSVTEEPGSASDLLPPTRFQIITALYFLIHDKGYN